MGVRHHPPKRKVVTINGVTGAEHPGDSSEATTESICKPKPQNEGGAYERNGAAPLTELTQ
eukprot:11161640-Lingulodinium_polyedra.AAC.1